MKEAAESEPELRPGSPQRCGEWTQDRRLGLGSGAYRYRGTSKSWRAQESGCGADPREAEVTARRWGGRALLMTSQGTSNVCATLSCLCRWHPAAGEQLGQAQIREAVSQHSDSQTSPEAQRQDAVAEDQRALCSLPGPCVHSNRFLSEASQGLACLRS